jgi:hypothetical protein
MGGAVLWLPALIGTTYVAMVSLRLPRLVHRLDWHTDAAAPFVLAERLRGAGQVVIPHFGVWTSLWWLLVTRDLPGHRQIWESTGWLFALVTVGLLGWATARVAGRWAGVTAAATALLVGPRALRSLLTVNFHVSTPFTAAVLGAYLVVLSERRSRLLAVALGLLVGANAASDPLLWVAGVVPFALASAVLAVTRKEFGVVLRAGLVVVTASVGAVATNGVMYSLGFRVVSLHHRLAQIGDLPRNTAHLARMVALLGGANYAFPGGYPYGPLRPLVALLAISAMTFTVATAIVLLAQRQAPVLCAFACYWAAAVALLSVAFVSTTNAAALGVMSLNYILTLALAAGAGVALFAFRSPSRQLAVAIAVSVVGIINLTGIAHGRAENPIPPVGTYERSLVSLLTGKRVTRGYAGYWDAQNLTWQSGMQLLVAPVWPCVREQLCRYRWSTVDSWFQEKPGPSFLIVDPTTGIVTAPPQIARDASQVHRFGPLTIYIFDHDLARQLRRAA